jgi:hypothetical protein
MTRLDMRLTRLERQIIPAKAPEVCVFWADDLTPCREHSHCDVERVTGTHYLDVIHLTFGDRG